MSSQSQSPATSQISTAESNNLEQPEEEISAEEFEKLAMSYEMDLLLCRATVHRSGKNFDDAPFCCPFPPCNKWDNPTPLTYEALTNHANHYSKSPYFTLSQRLAHRGLYQYMTRYMAIYETGYLWKAGDGAGSSKGQADLK